MVMAGLPALLFKYTRPLLPKPHPGARVSARTIWVTAMFANLPQVQRSYEEAVHAVAALRPREARQTGAVLVHFSTDFVFNGDTEPPVYRGRSAVAAERLCAVEAGGRVDGGRCAALCGAGSRKACASEYRAARVAGYDQALPVRDPSDRCDSERQTRRLSEVPEVARYRMSLLVRPTPGAETVRVRFCVCRVFGAAVPVFMERAYRE
jgi:hypothetical protein